MAGGQEMRPEPYYAHSVEGLGPPHWQPLEEHLRQVGALAGEFAAAFGSAAWGELAGLWHNSASLRAMLHANSFPTFGLALGGA